MVPCIVGLLLLIILIVSSYFVGNYYFSDDYNHLLLSVNPNNVIFETDKMFLSVALDTSFMRCLIHNLTVGEWERLEELSSLLQPAYLRLGGTDADRTFFDLTDHKQLASSCNSTTNLTINAVDWLKINSFSRNAGLSLILDLNVLLRKGPDWDTSNAEALIKFSEEHSLPLDFQLGNEPNSFPHVFNITLSGSQLAKDFHNLRTILSSTQLYKNSKLIGPDVTRPKHLETSSSKYLAEFLSKGRYVDAVSWHQYYLNGRNATLEDFINPKTLNVLSEQIQTVSKIVRERFENIPIWISETSSAYGGGAPKLSNRFASSFLWLDKLGLAAKLGMSVVIRQSLFKDHYALINENFTPTPDFWISFFYKNTVGEKVLDVTSKTSENEKKDYLRFYCHCAKPSSLLRGNVVIFGMNLSNNTELIVTSGLKVVYPIHAYIFRAELNILRSKTVLLNSKPLHYNRTTFEDLAKMGTDVEFPLAIPSNSIGFWILEDNQEDACKGFGLAHSNLMRNEITVC